MIIDETADEHGTPTPSQTTRTQPRPPSRPTRARRIRPTAVARPARAASLPAGTVLASRYRLEELLAESRPTVTWRAFDQVLSRSVLVHLLRAAAIPATRSELLAAARQASVATDSRFLRVLDAVHSDRSATLGSYIVCEYATGQSLEMILSHGPLSGLEAAWVVREVADALAGVHSLGLYHQRINPDTVIITPTGNVKIVGLLIEAALRPAAGAAAVHGADTPELVDVPTWAGCSTPAWCPAGRADRRSACPTRPALGRRWVTPAAGPGRGLPGAGQRLRPDPRRPAAAPGHPDHDRARRGQRADQGARQRRRVGGSGAPAAAADPAGRATTTATAELPMRCTNRPRPRRPADSPTRPTVPPRRHGTAAVRSVHSIIAERPSARVDRDPAATAAAGRRSATAVRRHGTPAAAPLDRPADRAGGPAAGHRRRSSPPRSCCDRRHRRHRRRLDRGAGSRRPAHPPAAAGPDPIAGAREFDPQGDPPNPRTPTRCRSPTTANPQDPLADGAVPRQPEARRHQARRRPDPRPRQAQPVRDGRGLALSGNGTDVRDPGAGARSRRRPPSRRWAATRPGVRVASNPRRAPPRR